MQGRDTKPDTRKAGARALGMALIMASAALAQGPVDFTTLEGKVLFGYQGWFRCNTAGTTWGHWSRGVPAPSTLTVEMYPDLREFQETDLCKAGSLTVGGRQAYLFSSDNPAVADAHFRWMKEHGLDGALVQRFLTEAPGKRRSGDVVLRNIMAAAAAHGRTFALEYDVTGSSDAAFAQALKDDWAYLVDQVKVTSHPNYLHHGGKPLLSVWGMGLTENHPPSTPGPALALVNWFKQEAAPQYRVFYMGGTPGRWRTLREDARPDTAWRAVYRAMDVVQPWAVGRYRTVPGVDGWRRDVLAGDVSARKAEGKLYMPVAFPGFSWYNLKKGPQNEIPRLGGRFLWRQAYNAKASGASFLKIAMYDEVDEGTAMFKLAPTKADVPAQGYWLPLDADGYRLPSDWYLRLAGEITKLFKGTRPADTAMPIDPTNPTSGGVSEVGNPGSSGLVMERRGGRFTFAASAGVETIALMTASGRRLATLPVRAGRAEWDGRDAAGRLPGPGVALVLPLGNAQAARPLRFVLP